MRITLLRITLAYYQHADYNILGKNGCVLKMSLNLLWIDVRQGRQNYGITEHKITKI